MTTESPETRNRSWGLADSVTLLGPESGSGMLQQTFLVQRSDGQVVQLSELLNTVLGVVGSMPAKGAVHTEPELARRVGEGYCRELDVDGLRQLIDTKLAPLGFVEDSASADCISTCGLCCSWEPHIYSRGRAPCSCWCWQPKFRCANNCPRPFVSTATSCWPIWQGSRTCSLVSGRSCAAWSQGASRIPR